jgi:hypothetical protein
MIKKIMRKLVILLIMLMIAANFILPTFAEIGVKGGLELELGISRHI